MKIYVLTTLDMEYHMAHMGYFSSLENAEQLLFSAEYAPSINECGAYPFAIVEEITLDEFEPCIISCHWYQYCEACQDHYREICQCPETYQGSYGFCLS